MMVGTVTADGDGLLHAETTCPLCGKTYTSPAFTKADYGRIQAGRHVQDVFPDWTPGDRELHFISGTCDACWKRMFPPEGEDGGDEEA